MADVPDAGSSNQEFGVRDIESLDAFDQLLTSEQRVLVDFYTTMCGPCNMMKSVVEDVATQTTTTVVKIDLEHLPELVERYDIGAVPAFLVFDEGDEVNRLIGMTQEGDLLAAAD